MTSRRINKGPRRLKKNVPSPQSPTLKQPVPLPAGPSGLPTIQLRHNEDRRVRRGHLWVFSNEVSSAPADLTPGTLVRFLTGREELLGVGYYNPRSLIAGRLLDRRETLVDAEFIASRLRRALDLRQRFFQDDAYRWVFGESDDLPGLVIDRYGDVCVVESFSAGVDRLLPLVVEALESIQPWKAIVLRNDASARRLEHLPSEIRVLTGTVDTPHWFTSDGLDWAADLLQGQKTGFFFDQRLNRTAVASLAKGRSVLDVFCHTGGFGLLSAKAGASRVVGVDSSAPALALAQLTAEKNGLTPLCTWENADAFEHLLTHSETFGLVVVDPPRLAVSKNNLSDALKAYLRLNTLALRRVSGGGFLASASCSGHVTREEFRQVLSRAAHESGRKVKIVFQGGQGPDHPIRPSMPETDYLKFALMHVL